ncbi:MAG: LysR family transcriptional regulator [Lachnospiraceae bacterium]|nr:LysR family transcriptional regulator [Lachnospiraceae bacterium]
MTDLQIRCFLEVATHLSFTRAAKGLFISQSNISRQISSLEEELGLPLFDRNTKGVRLTIQGQMLAETLMQMVTEWNNALARAKNSVRKFSGGISIGCQEHIKSNSYISQVLSGFREDRPEIQIMKERCTQRKLVEGLMNDYYDAILIADHDVKMVQGVEKVTLFYSRVGIVIHKSHPLFRKKDVLLSDFKDSHFLRYLPMKLKPEDDYFLNICAAFGFEPNVAAEFEDFEELLLAIEMGEGVSLVFEEDEVTSNMNLRFIPIEEDVPQKYLSMQLVRKNKNRNPALNDFYVYAQKYSNMHAKRDF